MRSEVGNASDAQQVKQADRRSREHDKQSVQDMRDVLAMPSGSGRRLLWRLIEHCGVFGEMGDYIYSDGPRTYTTLGRRDVGLALLTMMREANDDAVILMLTEQRDIARRLKAEIEASNTKQANSPESEE
jgi:hypothetical protein